jgi:hypothetical protein
VPDEEQGKRESLEDVKRGERRELDEIPPEEPEALLGQALKEHIEQKRGYGRIMLRMMAGQLVLANGIFVAVAWAGYDWKVPHSIMHVWLAATFVQIVSVVAIIVRALFSGADVAAAVKLAGRSGDG